jgi:GMP synthase (glutamine-hydrolysing)
MHIGILQCGHTPDLVNANHGDFDALFTRMFDGEGFSFTTFNVVDDEWPEDHLTADGWLVTGSKHGAYEDHAFIPPLEEFIRAVNQSDRPMVGICFGHQIIAQVLGGGTKIKSSSVPKRPKWWPRLLFVRMPRCAMGTEF